MGSYIEDLAINFINKSIKITKDEESIIRYGVKIVYYNLTKFAIILLTALLLDLVSEVCTVFFVMASIRSFSYGFHADNSFSCLILTLVTFFIFAKELLSSSKITMLIISFPRIYNSTLK